MNLDYIYNIANLNDIDDWMRFVATVKNDFPGLVMEDYRRILLDTIERQCALCVKYRDKIVGVLLYSVEQKTLSCMAVHPLHRRKGIATVLIHKMIKAYPKKSEIWVTTFREGDLKGCEPRLLYKKIGFVERKLTIEFDYPVQKLVYYT